MIASKRRAAIAVVFASVILLSLFVPVRAPVVGLWRLLNPVENTLTPAANLNGVFMLNGGTGGKGSGDGFAVGGSGLIYHWDGFSWTQSGSGTNCPLNSVNFGGPLNPLTSITRTSGWAVGGSAVCTIPAAGAVSFFYDGVSWTYYPVPGAAIGTVRGVFLVQSGSTGGSIQAVAVGNTGLAGNGVFWSWTGVPGSGAGWVSPVGWSTLDTTSVNSVYISHCTTAGGICSADDGWAVGDLGIGGTPFSIFHLVAGAWVGVQNSLVNLNGVAMSSTTRGWAVGASCTILQYSGAAWNPYIGACSDGATSLRSIVLVSSSEGWAVGQDSTVKTVILHGTSLDSAGPAWTQIPAAAPPQIATSLPLNSITFAPSGGNLWAVGNAGVAAFCLTNCNSNSAVFSTTTSPASANLNSVFMTSDSDGWAVGDVDVLNPNILRWNGFSWARAAITGPALPFYGVYLSGGSSGWAVGGTAATLATFHYDGTSWTQIAPPAPGAYIMRAVYMVSDSNSWAVGSAFPGPGPNGAIWHSVTSGGPFLGAFLGAPLVDLYTIYFDPTSGGLVGWVGGGNGGAAAATIRQTTDGGVTWPTPFTPGAGLPAGVAAGAIIRSLFFQDSTHGWAAGTKGTILYWNGVVWSGPVPILSPNPTTDDIYSIFVLHGPPADDGWASGVDTTTGLPILLHYDTALSAWVETPLPIAIPPGNVGTFNSLYLRSSTNGLAVGTTAGAGTLSYTVHLDPPEDGTTGTGGTVTTTAPPSTTTVTATSSSSSATSSATSSSATTETSTSVLTSLQTTTAVSTTTVVSMATATTSSSAAVTTPMTLPAIPGFPWESIIAGIIVGMTALVIARRRRK